MMADIYVVYGNEADRQAAATAAPWMANRSNGDAVLISASTINDFGAILQEAAVVLLVGGPNANPYTGQVFSFTEEDRQKDEIITSGTRINGAQVRAVFGRTATDTQNVMDQFLTADPTEKTAANLLRTSSLEYQPGLIEGALEWWEETGKDINAKGSKTWEDAGQAVDDATAAAGETLQVFQSTATKAAVAVVGIGGAAAVVYAWSKGRGS